MSRQVGGASKTRRLQTDQTQNSPTPDSFQTCGSLASPSAPALPGAGGREEADSESWAGSHLSAGVSQHWGFRNGLCWEPDLGSPPAFFPQHQAGPEGPGSQITRASNPCRQRGGKGSGVETGWRWFSVTQAFLRGEVPFPSCSGGCGGEGGGSRGRSRVQRGHKSTELWW